MPIPHDHSDHPVNALRCRECGGLIRSRYRHDFHRCPCGKCMVDGGTDYRRGIVGQPADYIKTEHEWETALEEGTSGE